MTVISGRGEVVVGTHGAIDGCARKVLIVLVVGVGRNGASLPGMEGGGGVIVTVAV